MKPHKDMVELCERLRAAGKNHARASQMLADAKSERQTDRDDYPGLGQRGYAGLTAEQTPEWQAASAIESLLSQIEEGRKALGEYDAAQSECPFTSNRPPQSDRPCPKCSATARDACGRQVSAAYAFVEAVRQSLARTAYTNMGGTDER